MANTYKINILDHKSLIENEINIRKSFSTDFIEGYIPLIGDEIQYSGVHPSKFAYFSIVGILPGTSSDSIKATLELKFKELRDNP